MRILPNALPACAILLTLCCSSRGFPRPAFDGERVMADIRDLTALGPRPRGSDNARNAATFIKDRLRQWGYQLEERRFPLVVGFKDRSTRLLAPGTDLQLDSAAALTLSPSVHLEAEAAAIESPLIDPDLVRTDLKGKIAIVPRGLISFEEKARRAAKAGAVGIVIYNSGPGNFRADLRTRGTFPALSLSAEEGHTLLSRLRKGPLRLRIDSETVVEMGEGRNIVATLPGSDEAVLTFGAHYDSIPNGIGANDNGSGIGVLLEMARVLAQSGRKETLVFIAFDAEEIGLLGSFAYVEGLEPSRRRAIRAAFIFDTLASPGNGPYFLEGSDWLAERAIEAGKRLDIPTRRIPDEGMSDHKSFLQAAIPSLLFYRRSGGLANTPNDTMDRLNAEWLAKTGHLTLAIIDTL